MKKKIILTLRGYKVLHGLIPGFLPVAAVRAILNAVLPFVNIIVSAMIINAIAEGAEMKRVVLIAVITAVINFSINGITKLLGRISSYLSAHIWQIDEQPLNEKQQEMDFERIEAPETRAIRQKLKSYRDTNRMGMIQLFWTFESFLTNFMTVALSIGVFMPVFTVTVTPGGFWGFVNTAWFAVLFVLLVVGNGILGMVLKAQDTKMNFKIFQGIHFPNMILLYLQERILNKYQMGKDIKVNKLGNCVDNITCDCIDQMMPVFDKLTASQVKYQSYSDFAANALNAVIYIFVAIKTALNNFPVGNIVQYIGGIARFNAGFTGLATNIAALFSNAEALEIYFDFLDKPNKTYHGTLPVEKRSDNEYEIEFRNVSFQYPGTDAYVLKNLNLKLNIGQRMAVVGMNGSGKTTMIKLLCRLYDLTGGEITLNGIDIKKYDYQEYMSIFSVVFQDFKLFSFPIGQNVAASVEFDADRVMKCLTKSGVADRVTTMPKGLDTSLYKDFDEDGVEISGGEAQKIAIARALYKNAPFIVLDEPTAALDPIAEFEVYSKLNDIVENKTAIFISHRLSSCRFCHDIAVFHEGELIQRGGHDELIADEDGKYYELWNTQAQYYVS